ncbi:hypothetical protein BVY03_00145 [bacterium K02(2017)]|nr:hypothetical protein BVY03_00145 [bacterium K02(2017)]
MKFINYYIQLFLCLSFMACDTAFKDVATEQYLKQYTNQTKPLEIDYYLPEGLTQTNQNKIVIHFTQPMIALSALGKIKTNNLVTITPKVNGYFKWVNTKTLIYQVKGSLPYATRFKISVKAGNQSLLGFALTKDFDFSFHTPIPQIVNVMPKDGNDKLNLSDPIRLTFNQNINSGKLKKFINLQSNQTKINKFNVECIPLGKDKKIPLDCQTVLITPLNKYKPDSPIELTIQKGVTGNEGPELSDVEYKYAYRTYGPFKITNINCDNRELCAANPVLTIDASNPISEEDFNKYAEFIPPVKMDKNIYGYWSNYHQKYNFYPQLKADTNYKLILKKELIDKFGQKLGEDFVFSFKTDHLKANINLSYIEEQVMHYHDKLNLGFVATNLKSVVASFSKSLSDKNIIDYYKDKESLLEKLGVENKWDFIKSFNGEVNNQKKFYSVPLQEIDTKLKSGIILSQYVSPEVTGPIYHDSGTKYYPITHTLIKQITDLAIDYKSSQSNGLIWVTSLTTGKAAIGSQVIIYDNDAHILFKGVCDGKGILKIPGQDELKQKSKNLSGGDKEDAKYPFYIFAKKDGDRSYISSNWQDGLGGYSYYDYYDYEEEPIESSSTLNTHPIKSKIKVRSHLLTDRGLYKPGEEVKIKGYLRQLQESKLQPFTDPIELKITAPNGGKPIIINVTPNKRGNFTAEYKVNPTQSLGYYSIKLHAKSSWVKFDGGYHNFQVEKFRTPEFKIEINTANKDVIKGDEIKFDLAAEYLFGAPLKKAKMKYYLNKAVSSFRPKNKDDWQFGRISYHEDIEADLLIDAYLEGEQILDDLGGSHLTFKTKDKLKDPVLFGLSAEVFDLSGQTQASYKSKVIHPANYYVGAKLPKMFYSEGEELNVNFATIKPDGAYVLDKKVNVELIRVEWVSVKRETLNGQYQIQSEKRETSVAKCEKVAKEKSNSCQLKFDKSGYYIIKLSSLDKKNRTALTELPVYVSGNDYAYWPTDVGHNIELVKDKSSYEKGDVAKIMVKSPYNKARALISIERDKVLSFRVQELTGSTPIIEVPLRSKHAPNIFVNVVLIRGADQIETSHQKDLKQVGEALVKAGQIELKVKPHDKNIKIEVKAKKEIYKPGDMAEVEFTVENVYPDDDAEITVMVVDEGVLLAGGYSLKDPIKTFYSPYYHKVGQIDSRTRYTGKQDIEGKLDSEASGGGKMKQSFRKKFIPLAYFNGEVITKNGKANISFEIPEQLTTFKVMAIANANNDRFGLGSSDFKTQKDLMIRPALPRFVRVSDKISSKVVLHNNTNSPIFADLKVDAELLTLKNKNNSKIKIPPHSSISHLVEFEAAQEKLTKMINENIKEGEHRILIDKIKFSATSANSNDHVQLSLPIHLDRQEVNVATSGVSTGDVSEFIKKTDQMQADFGNLDIKMSSNLWSKLKLKIGQLKVYPYDCLEQRLSKFYPYVLFPKRDDFFSGKFQDYSYRFNQVKGFLGYLKNNQSYNGEFKLWPIGKYRPHLTLMVAEFLIYAQQAGHDVSWLLKKLENRLFEYLKGEHYSLKSLPKEYINQLKFNTLYLFHLMDNPQYSYYKGLKPLYGQLDKVTQTRFVELLAAQDIDDELVQK